MKMRILHLQLRNDWPGERVRKALDEAGLDAQITAVPSTEKCIEALGREKFDLLVVSLTAAQTSFETVEPILVSGAQAPCIVWTTTPATIPFSKFAPGLADLISDAETEKF